MVIEAKKDLTHKLIELRQLPCFIREEDHEVEAQHMYWMSQWKRNIFDKA